MITCKLNTFSNTVYIYITMCIVHVHMYIANWHYIFLSDPVLEIIGQEIGQPFTYSESRNIIIGFVIGIVQLVCPGISFLV